MLAWDDSFVTSRNLTHIRIGYAATTFPGITEAVVAGNLTLAAEYVKRTADAILVAANIIKT